MKKETENTLIQSKSEIDEVIDKLTLFDDKLMSRVFDNNVAATELILRIILNKNIKVISVTGQNEMKNHDIEGRNITLDVHALDENGNEIDIEVQGNATGAHVKRARFHSSMIDSKMLKSGQKFSEMKDSHVIFIYKRDKFKKGLPVYHIDRYVEETEEPFDDGSHIIYVNGKYKGDDEIGQLIKDFHQSDSKKIHYKELARGVKHFKETEKGREHMGDVVEKYGKEIAIRASAEDVKNLMKSMKLSLEQALNALGIQGETRTKIIMKLEK